MSDSRLSTSFTNTHSRWVTVQVWHTNGIYTANLSNTHVSAAQDLAHLVAEYTAAIHSPNRLPPPNSCALSFKLCTTLPTLFLTSLIFTRIFLSLSCHSFILALVIFSTSSLGFFRLQAILKWKAFEQSWIVTGASTSFFKCFLPFLGADLTGRDEAYRGGWS